MAEPASPTKKSTSKMGTSIDNSASMQKRLYRVYAANAGGRELVC